MDLTQLSGRADLHMHTSASDGQPSAKELLDFITRHRPELNVIAITDHNTLDAALWACEQQHNYPFDIVPGVEVSSRDGHILALWVTQPIPQGLDLCETAAAIHEAGGMAILAHPFHIQLAEVAAGVKRYWRSPQVLVQSGIDAVEVYNAGVLVPFSNWLSGKMARTINITALGSSDAHTPGAVGRGITRFAGTTAADLRRAITAGQTIGEGRPWRITDYIACLRHLRRLRASRSSAAMSLSRPASS